jgi:hypothetical protein
MKLNFNLILCPVRFLDVCNSNHVSVMSATSCRQGATKPRKHSDISVTRAALNLPVHGSALHGDRCVDCCEAHTKFANESACLMAYNIWNEGKKLTLCTS